MHFNLFPGPVNFLQVCLTSFKLMFSFVISSCETTVTSAPVPILKLMVPFGAGISTSQEMFISVVRQHFQ